MSDFNIEQERKIAKLSRIRISEEELQHFSGELTKIIDWVEQLNEVDTQNVEPMISVIKSELPMRTDKVDDGGISEKILKNAPDAKYDCFVVPKVVE